MDEYIFEGKRKVGTYKTQGAKISMKEITNSCLAGERFMYVKGYT